MKDFAFLRTIAMIAAGSSGAAACAEVASEEAASVFAEDAPTGEETEPLALLQSPSVSANGSGCKSGTWSSNGASTPSIRFSTFETALNPPATRATSDCAIVLRTGEPGNVATGIKSLVIAGEGALPSGTKSELLVSIYAMGNPVLQSPRFTFDGNFYGSWEKTIFLPDNQVSFGCGTTNLNVRLRVSTTSDSGGLGSLVVREVREVRTTTAPCGR